MDCKLHPDTIWVPVKSLNVLACQGCLKDGFYIGSILKEAMDQNPELFK